MKRKVEKKLNSGKITEIFYNDRNSTLKELLTKDKPVTLHDRSRQVSVTEMFKVKKTIFIITIGDIFRSRQCCYKFRNTSQSKSYFVLFIIFKLWVTCPTEY